MIRQGRVTVAGRIVLDPESPTLESEPSIQLDGLTPQLAGKDAAAPLLADAEVFA